MTVREFLKKLRAARITPGDPRGWTQVQAAEKIGVSQGFYGGIETGDPVPLDKVEHWIATLSMNEAEATEFRILCLTAQAPELGARLASLELWRREAAKSMADLQDRETRAYALACAFLQKYPRGRELLEDGAYPEKWPSTPESALEDRDYVCAARANSTFGRASVDAPPRSLTYDKDRS